MAKKKVLIVDDMMFMRAALKKILEGTDAYEVVGEGENGEDGMKKYKALMPDIVTMDITMPDMDGLEALEKILAINPEAKIVMISAMGQEKNIVTAIKLGAKNFIVKPFKPEKVLEVLGKL